MREFMRMDWMGKERYVEQDGGRKRYKVKIGDSNYCGITMTHLLHRFHPRFLELDESWVDMLLDKEWDLKDEWERNCLMHLLESERLQDLDFGCRRFRVLLGRR